MPRREPPADDTWVFPFDQPLPPAEGDNQALAVNTTDGSVVYDVAFALVWADGDEVLNVNEAHAYASCSDCVAVAVAFQVVLIMDDAHVVVPQNLAVAANYDCYRCITAAIASQLVLSVEDEPGQEQLRALGEVWGRLVQFAQHDHVVLADADHRAARGVQGGDRRHPRGCATSRRGAGWFRHGRDGSRRRRAARPRRPRPVVRPCHPSGRRRRHRRRRRTLTNPGNFDGGQHVGPAHRPGGRLVGAGVADADAVRAFVAARVVDDPRGQHVVDGEPVPVTDATHARWAQTDSNRRLPACKAGALTN